LTIDQYVINKTKKTLVVKKNHFTNPVCFPNFQEKKQSKNKQKKINFKNLNWLFLFFSFLFLFLISEKGYAQTFTTSGTWTCPAGVTSIKVEAYGAGGGSGRGGASNSQGGGGGGGGAYTVSTITVVPSTVYNITIGSGGTAGTSLANGGDGTNTIFGASLVVANGGKGGQSYANGALGGAGGVAGTFSGGKGANGTNGSGSGGGGGCAGPVSNGGDGSVPASGAGGAGTNGGGMAGNGGTGHAGNSGIGTVGANYGGGAGGSCKAQNGLAGANGYLSITIPLVNDICSGAIDLTPAAACTPTTGSTTGATDNNETGDCTNGTENAVWYKFTATTATHIVTVDGVAGFDAVIGAISTCGSSTTPTGGACKDSTLDDGIETMTLTGLTIGQTYYVQVYDYQGDLMTNGFTICIQSISPCVTPTAQPTALVLTQPTNGTINGNFTAASPAPSNYLVVYNTTGTVPSPVNGTTYSIGGTVGAGNTVADIDANNTFSVSGLSGATTYYFFVFSYNTGSCSGGPVYFTTTPATGNATIPVFYCASTSTSSTYYINNFSTTLGTTNITNNGSGYSATGYGNFTAQTTTQQQFSSVNFSAAFTGGTFGFNIWVDWNDDADFNDTGEKVYASGGYVASATGSIMVPGTASAGSHRMRIVANYLSTDPSSCGSISSGETEDYTFTVTAAAACTTPTAQPTALLLTQPTNGTINGSFTAASPAPTNYLVVYNTTGVAPTPVNGTTYTAGGTVGAGNIVADTDNNTTFSLTSLTGGVTYYFFVFSNNAVCTGGPLYNTTSPATGNAVVPFYYCTANNSTNTTYYISGVSSTGGTANFTNTGTGFTAGGYIDYTATQAVSQNAGLGFSLTATHPSSTYGYSVWVDWNNDGDFIDAGESVLTTGYLSSPASLGTVTIPAGTPAGNYRMRVRNAYLSNPAPACGDHAYGETEDYRVTCLGPLPCSGNPSLIVVNVTSLTTATVNWTAATPAPANGYNYYYSTTNTAPTSGTTPSGSTAAGVVTANLTGLTSGTTYYIWVRSNCGGGLGQGAWVGPTTFYVPNCAVGPGTGTSALGCPSVVSGGLGLNGASPAPITCSSASSCVDLEATYLQLGQTTSYTAQSISYNPPYQFGCLANPVSVNIDDKWSPVINLPFNFCFYGSNYNQCLIGSNGVLSFDTTTNTPGGTNPWSFANSLPSTSLFKNTIFGVYQDIDPSKGGEVGWELITLNSGCRALVASWKDIPMFSSSCNSLLYTGMMVLYENTNIIEVYVQKKDICSSWNDGNAIIGVQDNTGTIATTAPNRNGLDTDWAVTNEAWRFVPSGTSITTIKWYEGAGTTGPVVGTTATINVCPAATTIYTAEVTYNLCNGTTLKETGQTTVTVSNNKVWNGVVNTDWNTANNWTPTGVPTALDCVIIPNTVNKPIISGTGYNGLAKNLVVQSGAVLTVNANNNITVTDVVNVNAGGDFTIKNNASLLQTNNVTNTGNIFYERTTRVSRPLDYTYWNTPVTGFSVGNLTTATSFIYSWIPTIGGGPGNWTTESPASTMLPSKGYIARAPLATPSGGSTYTVNFTGVPNNGNITIPIAKGTNVGIPGTTAWGTPIVDSDDQWNLIGNPYPSAVDIRTFLDEVTNKTLVDGTVYLWTHNTLPSSATVDPFYGNYGYNYTASDYATLNYFGGVVTTAGSPAPSVNIAGGQSFFVVGLNNGNAKFTNSMRVLNNNNNFFRSTDGNSTDDFNSDGERLWLNLSNNNGGFSQLLVGYTSKGTLDWDRGYDGENLASNAVTFYSIIPEKNLTIQARPLPFTQTDIVPLGYKATAQSNFTIGLDHLDSQFNDRNIYLEDKQLNVMHNLKTAPYSFSSEPGTFNNRFVLRYTESNLSNEDTAALENTVVVYTNEKLNVKSTLEPIKEVTVYDVLGRVLISNAKVNTNEFTASTLAPTDSTLIVKVTLENNVVITKKVVY
jgi:GEVED domain-containing protein/fibronectin type III domain protein